MPLDRHLSRKESSVCDQVASEIKSSLEEWATDSILGP